MRFDLIDIRLVLAIAQEGNLTEGAEKVFLTTSAASYRLRNLEQNLKAELFLRTPRGMEITPAGKVVAHYGRKLFSDLSLMRSEVDGFSQGHKGTVNLLVNSSSFNGFILPILGEFLQQYPHINISVRELPSEEIERAMMQNKADIGVLAGPVDTERLKSVFFQKDELVLAVPVGHSLQGDKAVYFEDILECDFISTSVDSSHSIFLRNKAQHYGKELNIRLYAQSFDVVTELVGQGVGVALVPRHTVHKQLPKAPIQILGLRDKWAQRELILITPREELPAYALMFFNFLLQNKAD